MACLSEMLREGTKHSHSLARNVGLIKALLKGVVDKHTYGVLASNLHHVYSALEEELEHRKNDAVISKIHFPELYRTGKLEHDMIYHFGSSWRSRLPAASAATRAYVQRIREVASLSPELLVAHAYTRYLGDLSGGQIVRKILRQVMRLPEGRGTEFFEFDAIPDVAAFKSIYRERLDQLPLNRSGANRMVREANLAFAMNIQLLRETEKRRAAG